MRTTSTCCFLLTSSFLFFSALIASNLAFFRSNSALRSAIFYPFVIIPRSIDNLQNLLQEMQKYTVRLRPHITHPTWRLQYVPSGGCFGTNRVQRNIHLDTIFTRQHFLSGQMQDSQWERLPTQVQIQDLVKGGPQVLRPKVADVVKRSRASKASNFVAGVQGPLKGPGSFWVFNAQICILPHSRDSFSLIFDIYFNTKS